ncbi:MAG TPA: SPASM domain-containing protein [Syntrophales bacterium]|jgi:radical SAM protein with 4Fe4S-binding SPASM domain|nr:SPASM domain-containing protein [Syntrophales bacterium]
MSNRKTDASWHTASLTTTLSMSILHQFLNAYKVQIQDNELCGLPDFMSPYLSMRDAVGKAILDNLKRADTQVAPNHDVLWGLRSPFPVCACINVHNWCNESCIICPRHLSENHRFELMPEQVFAEIVRQYSENGGRILTFNNFSDIFAHPSGIEYIEHALSYPSLQVYLVTNGLNMRQSYTDRILRARFEGIVYISCHGFTEETFERVTGVRGFHAVLSNILYLKERHPCPRRIIIQYCADYSTDAEIRTAVDYWKKIGVSLNLFRSHTFSGNSGHNDQAVGSGRLAGCKGWGHDAGQPFYQIVIQHNGDVTLCCHDYHRSVVLGNVLKTSISEVWNSEAFRYAIGQIYAGLPSDAHFICKRCHLAQFV